MQHQTKNILATALMISITGCSIPTPTSKVIDMSSNEIAVVSNSAETTSTIYQSGTNKAYYCSSNAPDSTFSTSQSAGFSLSVLNYGTASPESENSSGSSSGQEMLGRTPAVLAARDIMYRACELIGNVNLTPQQAIAVYTESMKIAASILTTEAASRTVSQTSNLGIQVSETTAVLPSTDVVDDSD